MFYSFSNIFKRAVRFCSLFSFSLTYGQQYQFVNLTTDDGLVQSQVMAMIQDKQGYLWFATYGGLSCFDGLKFENYGIEDGLMGNRVHALFLDEKSRMWIGYTGGIGYFQNKKFYTVNLEDDLNQSNVSSICEDTKGRTWVSFEDAGVGYVIGNKFIIPENGGLPGYQVRSVHCDKNGDVWVASASGVFKWNENNKKFESSGIEALNGVSASDVTSFGNTMYVSTFGDGVFIINNNRVKHLNAENGLIEDHIRNLYIDSRGELWAASIAGVSHYRNNEIINFYSENGLPIENIRFVSEDNEGNIWMGTDGKGVLKFAGESFVAFTVEDGLSSELIVSILQDAQGDFWFGTHGKGLIRYNGKEYTQYSDMDGLSNNIVWASCETPDHKLWFGTSDGLCTFDGKEFSIISDTSAYVSNRITRLLAMPDGSVWIGRRTGASLMKADGTVVHYDARHGLHGGNIRSMIVDDKGILWLGGASGLYSFDGKKFKLYKPNPLVEDNTVYCIVRFPNGRLWVGTNSGLFVMENGKFTKLYLSENPNANIINFLLPDGKELWVGTNSGIYEVFPADRGKLNELTVVAYTKYEGVRGTETNLNACYRDRKGRLWFGTDAGLIRYDRSLDKGAAMFPPYMHITDVRIFFAKPDWKKYSKKTNTANNLPIDARVPYNRNHFTFYFTGISHSNPSRLRYVFKLDGFDDKWSPPTNADFATYTYLPDGNYTFRVKCLNRDGVWSKEAKFSFSIIPPFWRTWWFFVMVFSVCAVIAVLFWRWRIAVLKRKNKTLQLYYHSKLLSLEQQSLNASMNRHFIFNSLNSIQYYINKQDRLEANRYLTNFAKLIRKNLDSSVNGENAVSLNEELERIKLYLSLEMMRFKDKFTYELTVAPEIDLEMLKIPPMLLQPYIENSIWHGILPTERPGQLDIRIYYSPGSREKICIEIMDNGIGIDVSLARKVNNGSTHISRGIEITSGRLNLLKKMTSQDLEIHGPEQVEGPNGSILGTRVLLIISTKALIKKELRNANFSEKSFEF